MRKISSRMTWFYKFMFPTIWIGGFSAGTIASFLVPASANMEKGNPALSFLFLLILGSLFIYAMLIRLKSVSLDGADLVVSNYKRTIRVSLRNVENVSGSLFMSPEMVWVSFKVPTDFGLRIHFMAPLRFFMGLTRPPIAGELMKLVQQARGY